MPSGNSINSEKFISRTMIYLIIIAVLLLSICIYNYRLIPVAVAIYTLLIIYTNWTNKKRKAELSDQLRDLTLNVNNTAKTTLINSPFPLVMIETTGNIIWKSEKFVNEFANIDINQELNEILKEIKITIENSEKKEKGNINTNVQINGRDYNI